MSLELADVSEWQGAVDWAAYAASGHPAATARLSYGALHRDIEAVANIVGMRAHLQMRNWYHYLTASDDPVIQANLFCSMLGHLQLDEAITVDLEEGTGNQEPRAAAFLARCNQLLGVPASRDIEYSGLYFIASHGGWVPGTSRWVAAYQTNPPVVGQILWQHSDAVSFPGIAKPCDGSVFPGTLNQLLAIINPPGGAHVVQVSKPPVGPICFVPGLGPADYWVCCADGGVITFGKAPFFGSLGAAKVTNIVGMAAHGTGKGYWLVGSDGGVFAFGDAPFDGSEGGKGIGNIIGIAATQDGRGYTLQAADGTLYIFGDAVNSGRVQVA